MFDKILSMLTGLTCSGIALFELETRFSTVVNMLTGLTYLSVELRFFFFTS